MPRYVQKKGYLSYQPTGMEQFSQMFAHMMQGVTQAIQQKKENQAADAARKEAIEKEQANMQLMLSQLGTSNPEAYNELIQSPEFQRVMDPTRASTAEHASHGGIQEWLERRKGRGRPLAGYGPRPGEPGATPSSSGLPEDDLMGPDPALKPLIPGTSLKPIGKGDPRMVAFQQARDLTAAQAKAGISEAKLKGGIADTRLPGVGSKDFIEAYTAEHGEPPTPQQIAVHERIYSKEILELGTPGTIPFKQAESRKLSMDLLEKRPALDPTLKRRVEQYADWVVGLTDEMPEALPPTLAQEEGVLNKKRYELSMKAYGLDASRLQMQRDEVARNMTFEFMKYDMDPALAQKWSTEFLRTGQLPTDFKIAPDSLAGIQQATASQVLKLREEEVKAALASDPVGEQLLKTAMAIPATLGPKSTSPRLDSEAWKAYVTWARSKGIMPEAKAFQPEEGSLEWLYRVSTTAYRQARDPLTAAVNYGATGSLLTPRRTVAPGQPGETRVPVTRGTDEEATRGTGRQPPTAMVPPELTQAATNVGNEAVAMSRSGSPQVQAVLRPKMEALHQAEVDGDPAKIAQASRDLKVVIDSLKALSQAPSGGPGMGPAQ